MRLKHSSRGQVLLQVLATAIVVAVIAAALMRLVLMRATVAAKLSGGSQGKMATQSGYQLLMQDWACNGTCHDPGSAPSAGCAASSGNPFTCVGGGANTCGCSCSGAVSGITVNVTTSGSPSNCAVSASTVGQ